jgi:hypothetical protein
MVDALEEFKAFEQHADAQIAELALWRKPIRSILSVVYLYADGMYVGKRFDRKGRRNDEVGTAMITRMSYVAKFFDKCSREVGANIDNALSVVDVRFSTDIAELLGYAHLCEIMPLVRRGFFSVQRQPSVFVLNHPGEEFVKHEENDILMSEMVLPQAHGLAPPPYQIENCKRMI